MRVKFEATDATGKLHKRSSASHIYSHCLVIHLAAHPPSNLWPKGIAACSLPIPTKPPGCNGIVPPGIPE